MPHLSKKRRRYLRWLISTCGLHIRTWQAVQRRAEKELANDHG